MDTKFKWSQGLIVELTYTNKFNLIISILSQSIVD
jgi:hypothetical protein